jgi:hypothetical protein
VSGDRDPWDWGDSSRSYRPGLRPITVAQTPDLQRPRRGRRTYWLTMLALAIGGTLAGVVAASAVSNPRRVSEGAGSQNETQHSQTAAKAPITPTAPISPQVPVTVTQTLPRAITAPAPQAAVNAPTTVTPTWMGTPRPAAPAPRAAVPTPPPTTPRPTVPTPTTLAALGTLTSFRLIIIPEFTLCPGCYNFTANWTYGQTRPAPTGRLIFSVNGQWLENGPVSPFGGEEFQGSGHAFYIFYGPATMATNGPYTGTASYSGDANWRPASASVVVSQP